LNSKEYIIFGFKPSSVGRRFNTAVATYSCDLLSKLPTVLLRGVFLHYRSQRLPNLLPGKNSCDLLSKLPTVLLRGVFLHYRSQPWIVEDSKMDSCDLLSKLPTVLLRGVFLHYRSQQHFLILTFAMCCDLLSKLPTVLLRGVFLHYRSQLCFDVYICLISCDLLSKLPTVLLRGVFLHYRSQQDYIKIAQQVVVICFQNYLRCCCAVYFYTIGHNRPHNKLAHNRCCDLLSKLPTVLLRGVFLHYRSQQPWKQK